MATTINMTKAELLNNIQHDKEFRSYRIERCRHVNKAEWNFYLSELEAHHRSFDLVKEYKSELSKLNKNLDEIKAERKPWVRRDPTVWDRFKIELGDDELYNELKKAKWPPMSKLDKYAIRMCNRERRQYGDARAAYYQFDIIDTWQREHDAKIEALEKQIRDTQEHLQYAERRAATEPTRPTKWVKPDLTVDFDAYEIKIILERLGFLSCDSVESWEYTTHLGSSIIRTTHILHLIDGDITIDVDEDDYGDEEE